MTDTPPSGEPTRTDTSSSSEPTRTDTSPADASARTDTSSSGESTRPDILDCPDCLDPADAFALLGNETRLDILRALWRADDRPVAFSDLRRAVGMRDSAQFNYHLGRLTDQFVTKTADGYDFRYAGEKVVRAVLAGTFTDRREFSLAAPGRCHDCGGDLVASYDDERFTIACADCAATFGRDPFPPGGLADRDPDEVLAAFDQHVRHRHCLAADGVCPECGGRTETELRDGDDALGTEYCVSHCCRQCNHCVHSPVGLSLLDNSRVVGFCGDHGVELTDHPYWTLAWCVRDDTTTVESRDPLRVTVGIPLGDERLDVTLDDDLRVLDTTRTSRGADAGGLAEPT